MGCLIEFARENGQRKVIPLAGFPGVQLTNTTLKENLCNSNMQADSLTLLAMQIAPDAIFTMMDLSVEAGAMGLPVRIPDNESPSVEQHPIQSLSDLESLKKAGLHNENRMHIFTETVQKLKERLDIPVGAYVAGPYTLAGLMMGASEIAMACIENSDLVYSSIAYAQDVIAQYAQKLYNAGADMICILDPTAMMLSPDMYKQYASDPAKQIIAQLDCPGILHICGNTTHLIEPMCQTGADALSLDSNVSMPEVITRIPENCVLIGNINPVATVQQGSRQKVMNESIALLEDMRKYDNFILSTGCDLPLDTPIENIYAMKRAVSEHENYLTI